MGHIGLTPQSVNQLGGYKVQGKTVKAAVRLMEDARALEDAGAFAVVLECVPEDLSALITEKLSIPTIGIGAGPNCDGQVQVFHDMLGILSDFKPKHTKQYTNLNDIIRGSIQQYAEEVRGIKFPTSEHSYRLNPEILSELSQQVT